jgi:transcriptional regulator with XRE-family HTH domain
VKQRNGRRYNKLRAILKAARLEAGLTQRELSAKLRRDKNFAQLVESGERALDAVEFIEYAEMVDVDPRDVIDELMK